MITLALVQEGGPTDYGHAARLVDPAAMPQYDELNHGHGDRDALHLVELMRLGLHAKNTAHTTCCVVASGWRCGPYD